MQNETNINIRTHKNKVCLFLILKFKNKKYKLAADNVHKLKHKISILGLEKSYEIAIAFENNLIEGDTSLYKEFETILNTITNYLQKL